MVDWRETSFLFPDGNEACRRAVQLYQDALSDSSTFAPITLEAMVAAIGAETDAPWSAQVRERYLDWEAVDRAIQAAPSP